MMNPAPPLLCSILLAAMMAAGASHFWTVREVISRYPSAPAILVNPSPIRENTINPVKETAPHDDHPAPTPLARGSEEEREFFANLLSEMKALRDENKDLTEQIGETNRDVMQFGFRLDTYSDKFRPLPVQERFDADGVDPYPENPEFPGVLPPKATPVYPLEE